MDGRTNGRTDCDFIYIIRNIRVPHILREQGRVMFQLEIEPKQGIL